MKCLTCHGLITNGNCGCSTGTQGAASVNIAANERQIVLSEIADAMHGPTMQPLVERVRGYVETCERLGTEKAEALAANAELRAAGLVAHDHACKMAEFHGPRCEEHERHDEAPDDCLRCAADTAFGLAFAELRKALSRPDLGVGKVLVAGPLDALVDNLVRVVCDCHDGSDLWAHTRRDPEAFRRAVRGALLKKGGG